MINIFPNFSDEILSHHHRRFSPTKIEIQQHPPNQTLIFQFPIYLQTFGSQASQLISGNDRLDTYWSKYFLGTGRWGKPFSFRLFFLKTSQYSWVCFFYWYLPAPLQKKVRKSGTTTEKNREAKRLSKNMKGIGWWVHIHVWFTWICLKCWENVKTYYSIPNGGLMIIYHGKIRKKSP